MRAINAENTASRRYAAQNAEGRLGAFRKLEFLFK